MAYQFDKTEREEAATSLEQLLSKDGQWMYFDNRAYLDAIKTAVKELRRPNPCDNCVGPGLAMSHGYSDMRVRTEEDN